MATLNAAGQPINPCRGYSPRSFPKGVWVEVPVDKISIDASGTATFTFEPAPNEGYFEFGGVYFDGIVGDGDGDGDGDADEEWYIRMTQVEANGDEYLNRKTGENDALVEKNGYAIKGLTREALYGHGCCDGFARGGPAGRLFQSVRPIKNNSTMIVTLESTSTTGWGIHGATLLVRRMLDGEMEGSTAAA